MRAAILLAGTLALTAQESTIQTVDGLNRPLPGVEITVYCGNRPHHLSSDANGHARGPFDKKTCISASVAKSGYTAYSSGFRDRMVLNRQLTATDAERLLNIGTPDAIRELLASDTPKLNDAIFQFEHRLRPTLRTLLKDPQFTRSARYLLAMIAEPKDIERILTLPPPPADGDENDYWRYAITTALIQPTTESGWQFLERGARGDYEGRWVATGAIQSLQLNGTARSQALLRSLRITPDRSPSLADRDLETAAKNIAMALGPKTWQANDAPRFNEAGDKALIDLTLVQGRDRLIYTATFHKINDSWTLRNVYETYQAFSPPPPPPPKP